MGSTTCPNSALARVPCVTSTIRLLRSRDAHQSGTEAFVRAIGSRPTKCNVSGSEPKSYSNSGTLGWRKASGRMAMDWVSEAGRPGRPSSASRRSARARTGPTKAASMPALNCA